MSGVIIRNGNLAFTPAFAFEASALAYGVEGARKRIKRLRKKLKNENDRSAFREMDKIPVIVPTSREEIYDRCYALVREVGAALRKEISRVDLSSEDRANFHNAFCTGFFDAAMCLDKKEKNYVGTARLFYAAGRTVANMTASVFPDDGENAPLPSVEEILTAFWRGVWEGPR